MQHSAKAKKTSTKAKGTSAKRRSPLGSVKAWMTHIIRGDWLPTALFKKPSQQSHPLAQLTEAARRTPEQWKAHRSYTRAAVRAHLEAREPIPAIQKLTLALLQDPEFETYHNLLAKAAEQRHLELLKPGEDDPWASMHKDLRTEVVKLEAFTLYVNQLEAMLDEAGVPASQPSTISSSQK